MDEDILAIVLGAHEKAIALEAVEPLHLYRLEFTGLLGQSGRIDPVDARRRGTRRVWNHGIAEIDRQHLARLQAPLLLGDQALDDRAFGKASPVMLLQNAEMDQYVAFGLVADQEA